MRGKVEVSEHHYSIFSAKEIPQNVSVKKIAKWLDNNWLFYLRRDILRSDGLRMYPQLWSNAGSNRFAMVAAELVVAIQMNVFENIFDVDIEGNQRFDGLCVRGCDHYATRQVIDGKLMCGLNARNHKAIRQRVVPASGCFINDNFRPEQRCERQVELILEQEKKWTCDELFKSETYLSRRMK